MLTTVQAGPFTIRGVSVGGIYTALHVPQLGVLLDVGIAPRSFASEDVLLLSHAHADHVGALVTLLGLRGLMSRGPLRIAMPKAVVEPLVTGMRAMSQLQRYELAIEPIPMEAGDEVQLKGDLWARAFPTFHPVPSLGYQLVRRVKKLRPELVGLAGAEIARRRKAGEDVHVVKERLELAYATDTLIEVIDETPAILESRVLVMECSFLDDRKDRKSSRAGCHIHLDELAARADSFKNEHLVLMHFSQIYRPREIASILADKLPAELFERVIPFAPNAKHWPG
jgi:ribonuclease Z